MTVETVLIQQQGTGLLENSSRINRLEKLYQSKKAQLSRLEGHAGSLRFLVLQAEAEAICQELRHLGRQ